MPRIVLSSTIGRSGESFRQGTRSHLDDISIAGGQDWIHLWDYFSQHK
ncbi:hypothetical protein QT979_23550 [Microcoleus sp. w2-18bC1]